MSDLNLNFLKHKEINWDTLDPIEKILHKYGQAIYEYAKGYFNYVVTSGAFENSIREASLYIIVPKIGYDYRILTLSYEDAEHVKVSFYTLQSKQEEADSINFKQGWDKVEGKVQEFLSSTLANKTLKFLVDQVEEKRAQQEEI